VRLLLTGGYTPAFRSNDPFFARPSGCGTFDC
jgi:hypothetical protein